jgi:hypothetical protein
MNKPLFIIRGFKISGMNCKKFTKFLISLLLLQHHKNLNRLEQNKTKFFCWLRYTETRWIRNTESMMRAKYSSYQYHFIWMGSVYSKPLEKVKPSIIKFLCYYVASAKKKWSVLLHWIRRKPDKFKDAASSMNELLTTMPELKNNLELKLK